MGRIPKLMTRTKKQLLLAHAITHTWRRNLRKFDLTCVQARREHNRLVVMMRKRGINHKSPMKC
jgi:hypothetical protein